MRGVNLLRSTSTKKKSRRQRAKESQRKDERAKGRLASRTVDGVGVVIACNSNRSDEDGGKSGDGLQPRGPSRMNGSPGRGPSLPEPHSNAGV